MSYNQPSCAAGSAVIAPADALGVQGTDNEKIVERAFVLAESGRFASLEDVKRQLKREGFVTVETALRALLTRRELRASCSRARRT